MGFLRADSSETGRALIGWVVLMARKGKGKGEWLFLLSTIYPELEQLVRNGYMYRYMCFAVAVTISWVVTEGAVAVYKPRP